jgi:hypothetical protein
MLSQDQVEGFARDGAVTIDSPLTGELLAEARGSCDRLLTRERFPDGRLRPRAQRTNDFYEQPLLDIIQHPFLERAATDALRAEAVDYVNSSLLNSYPEPDRPAGTLFEHCDCRYPLSDLDAVPRRIVCGCFVWLTDVTPDRAPLLVRPGSHRLISAWTGIDPERFDRSFRDLVHLPALGLAEPVPVLARAGQVTLLDFSVMHAASVNTGAELRRALTVTFVPRGGELHNDQPGQAEARTRFHRELWSRLRPERRHIIPVRHRPAADALAGSGSA